MFAETSETSWSCRAQNSDSVPALPEPWFSSLNTSHVMAGTPPATHADAPCVNAYSPLLITAEPEYARPVLADDDLAFLEEDLSDDEIRQYVQRLHVALRDGWESAVCFIEGYAAAGRTLRDPDVRQSIREQLAGLRDDHE